MYRTLSTRRYASSTSTTRTAPKADRNTLYRTKSALLAIALTFAYFCTAHAAMSLPGFVPNRPIAQHPIAVQVKDGTCDAIIEATGFPSISRNGHAIRVLLETLHAEQPILCIFPSGVLNVSLGSLEAGNYTVQVDRHLLDQDIVETVGILPLAVSEAAQVPALSEPSLIGMALGVLFIGKTILGSVSRHTRADPVSGRAQNFTQGLWIKWRILTLFPGFRRMHFH